MPSRNEAELRLKSRCCEIEQVDTSARADPSRCARPESDAELEHERGIELEHAS